MREFVMGDIHGAWKALRQCLDIVQFDYEKDRLIQLGDVVDRNEQSYECVEELLRIRNLIAIRGNHDDWLDRFWRTGHHPGEWAHGGPATIMSYLSHAKNRKKGKERAIRPRDIPKRHRAFFAGMQPYHIDESGRCFVHGGFHRLQPFLGQAAATYYWDRTLWAEALRWQTNERESPGQPPFEIKTKFREIFIGHTPTLNWGIPSPMRAYNIYNLDTGANKGGRLSIMEVKTKRYWQSDPVAELYKKAKKLPASFVSA